MAVHYVQGSSPFGKIGSIASIAGMVTGQPWFSALGTGMNALSGGGYTTPGFMNKNNSPVSWLNNVYSGNFSYPDFITQGGK